MDVTEATEAGRPENAMTKDEIVAAVLNAEDPRAKLKELWSARLVTVGLEVDLRAVLDGKISVDQIGTDYWYDGRVPTDPNAPKPAKAAKEPDAPKVARSAAVPKPGKAPKSTKVADAVPA